MPPPPSAYAKVFYDYTHPASYSSAAKLAKAVLGATLQSARQWLEGEDVYTLHRSAKKRFRHDEILVETIDCQWSVDLIDVQALAKENRGFKYLLTCVDELSKYAWVVPLWDKKRDMLVKSFHSIFAICRQPE